LKRKSEYKVFSAPCKERKNIEEGDREQITTGVRKEEVNEFCYLGNVLDCEAGLERAVTASVAAAWKNGGRW